MDTAVDAGGLEQVASRMIAKAWADEEFKGRLLADPLATIRAEGVAPATGLHIKVHENTPGVMHHVMARGSGGEPGITAPAGSRLMVHRNNEDTMHFVLPEKPSRALSDSDLDHVAGGTAGMPNLGGLNASLNGVISSQIGTINFNPPFGSPGS